jgi:hypothetical protein
VSNETFEVGDLLDQRRSTNRWPIVLEVQYKVLSGKQKEKQAGSGQTLNISGKGVLFTTKSPLIEGQLVELTVSWPARLNGVLPLKLVAQGRVVRIEENRAAINIKRYEFKTCGSSGF